jgi:transcriptional regulator with XRE-family HTH domain
MSFGEMLQKLRKQWDMSQRSLGEKVGIDFTYISKMENGVESPPSEDILIKMAEVFGVNKYDFIIAAGKTPTDFHKLILADNEVRECIKSKLVNERINQVMEDEHGKY